MSVSSESLKTLEVRKRLLVAEAEIHRQRFVEDLLIFKDAYLEVQGKVQSVRSYFSMGSLISNGISAFSRLRGNRGALTSRLLTGAGLVSSLWLASRARAARARANAP